MLITSTIVLAKRAEIKQSKICEYKGGARKLNSTMEVIENLRAKWRSQQFCKHLYSLVNIAHLRAKRWSGKNFCQKNCYQICYQRYSQQSQCSKSDSKFDCCEHFNTVLLAPLCSQAAAVFVVYVCETKWKILKKRRHRL